MITETDKKLVTACRTAKVSRDTFKLIAVSLDGQDRKKLELTAFLQENPKADEQAVLKKLAELIYE